MYCHSYSSPSFKQLQNAVFDIAHVKNLSSDKVQRTKSIKNHVINDEISAHLITQRKPAHSLGRFFHSLIHHGIINTGEIKFTYLNYYQTGNFKYVQNTILEQNNSAYYNRQRYYTILIELNNRQLTTWPKYGPIIKQEISNYYQLPLQETTLTLASNITLKLYHLTASVVPYICNLNLCNTHLNRRTLTSSDVYSINILNNISFNPSPNVHPQIIANTLDMFKQNTPDNAQQLNKIVADVLPSKNVIIAKDYNEDREFKYHYANRDNLYDTIEYLEDYHHQENILNKQTDQRSTSYIEPNLYLIDLPKLLPFNDFSDDNPAYPAVNQTIINHFDLN